MLSARQYEKALEQCRKTLELDPNYGVVHDVLGFTYLKKGMDKEAIAEYQRRKDEPGMHRFYFAYALPGMRDESLRLLEKMKALWKQGQIRSYPIARVYAGLSEEGPALEWLEKSFEEHEPYIIRLNVDPAFDSLRSKPRFKALLKKIGLE
jgi:tetratricopeptide (TPR) repeat protein